MKKADIHMVYPKNSDLKNVKKVNILNKIYYYKS